MAQEQRPAGRQRPVRGVATRGARIRGTRTEGSGQQRDIPATPATRMPPQRPPKPTDHPVACDVREMQLNHAAKYFRDCCSHKGALKLKVHSEK